MKKKILLTGASGFIGKHLLHRLEVLGYDITLVLRNTVDNKNKFENQGHRIVWTENVFNEKVEWWADACSKIDMVMNLAWYTNHSDYLISDKNIECMNGSIRMVEGAISAGIQTIIGVGTCLEYEMTSNSPVDISQRLCPKTIYGFAKMATFLTTQQLLRDIPINFIWFRPFFLYGDGENDNKLSALIKSSVKKGKSFSLENAYAVRDFIEINEAADIILNSIISGKSEVINLCTGKPTTVHEFALQITHEIGGDDSLIRIKPPDKKSIFPDYIVGIR